MVQFLEELSILVDNPGRGENEQSLTSEYYKEAIPLGHLIHQGIVPYPSTTHMKASSTRLRYPSICGKTNKGSRGLLRGIPKKKKSTQKREPVNASPRTTQKWRINNS
jgi:hypothetical protein